MHAAKFYFDVVCPYSYIAATQISKLAERCHASIEWVPVLLGGLYEKTGAAQGKEGSASAVMPAAKQRYTAFDLRLQAERLGVPLRFNSRHPVRSVQAQRLLCGRQQRAVRAAGPGAMPRTGSTTATSLPRVSWTRSHCHSVRCCCMCFLRLCAPASCVCVCVRSRCCRCVGCRVSVRGRQVASARQHGPRGAVRCLWRTHRACGLGRVLGRRPSVHGGGASVCSLLWYWSSLQ